jgi:hypothetical protein
MGLKDWLKEKWEEAKARREEEKTLRKIYETRKEALKTEERRKAAHELAEKHARIEARAEIQKKFASRSFGIPPTIISGFKTAQRYARRMSITQNSFSLPDVPLGSMRYKKMKRRTVDFSKYL